jgi:hypothetical protein
LEGVGELLGESDPLIELADRREPGIAGQWCGRDLDIDEPGRQEIE